MSFAIAIRKKMLQALEGHIIPILQEQGVAQVLLGPPFRFGGFESHLVCEEPLVDKPFKPLEIRVSWEPEKLTARRMAQLGFIFAGDYWEQVGITQQQAQDLPNSGISGRANVRLQAPVVFYIPPYVAHGYAAVQNTDEKKNQPVKILYIQFSETHCLLRLADSTVGVTHSLYIREAQLVALNTAFVQALEQNDLKNSRLHLLNIANYLRGYLSSRRVTVSNTAWPDLSTQFSLPSDTSPKKIALCYQAIDFIQFNLHTALDTQMIAEACGVSYMHLNRIFHDTTGLPLMHWVTKCRLDAAQLMLEKTTERIADIAQLVGFANSQSFSSVFSRHVGISPREYRNQYRANCDQ